MKRSILSILVLLLLNFCSTPVEQTVKETKPVIISTPVKSGTVNKPFIYDVDATGHPAPVYTLTTAPPGMIIDNTEGIISWIPSTGSDFTVNITVEATNTLGASSQNFDIRIGGLHTEGWETSLLSSEKMDQTLIDKMLSQCQNEVYPRIHSIIIVRNGKLVLEEYFKGIPFYWPNIYGQETQFNRSMLHHNASVTKSFISILMGIAIEKNFINSIDDKPFDFFPEYESYLNWDDFKSKISLKDLLTMKAGFEWQEDGDSFFSLIYPSSNWIKSALDLPVIYEPGTNWDYFSPGPDILGAVISKASGLHLSEFADQYLFDLLGITDVEWYITPTGRAFGGGCHRMKPIDMAKIGYLFLNSGKWQGEQIISRSWIAESTIWQHINYGYLWWKHVINNDNSLINAPLAAGFGGQRIYIIPDLDMVVVFTAGYYDKDEEMLGGEHTHEIIEKYIVPSVMN